MKTAILFIALTACLRRVPAEPRDGSQASRATVRVHSTCSEPDPFGVDPNTGLNNNPDIEWRPGQSATGVVISEGHVLTAAHVVECPIIPDIIVTFPNGEWRHMQVERDDKMFPHSDKPTDLARLEMSSSEWFGLGIAPPTLAPDPVSGDVGTAMVLRGRPMAVEFSPGVYKHGEYENMATRPGDSGAGVYDFSGNLVGIVVAGNGTDTAIERVTPYWMEGLSP